MDCPMARSNSFLPYIRVSDSTSKEGGSALSDWRPRHRFFRLAISGFGSDGSYYFGFGCCPHSLSAIPLESQAHASSSAKGHRLAAAPPAPSVEMEAIAAQQQQQKARLHGLAAEVGALPCVAFAQARPFPPAARTDGPLAAALHPTPRRLPPAGVLLYELRSGRSAANACARGCCCPFRRSPVMLKLSLTVALRSVHGCLLREQQAVSDSLRCADAPVALAQIWTSCRPCTRSADRSVVLLKSEAQSSTRGDSDAVCRYAHAWCAPPPPYQASPRSSALRASCTPCRKCLVVDCGARDS